MGFILVNGLFTKKLYICKQPLKTKIMLTNRPHKTTV